MSTLKLSPPLLTPAISNPDYLCPPERGPPVPPQPSRDTQPVDGPHPRSRHLHQQRHLFHHHERPLLPGGPQVQALHGPHLRGLQALRSHELRQLHPHHALSARPPGHAHQDSSGMLMLRIS